MVIRYVSPGAAIRAAEKAAVEEADRNKEALRRLRMLYSCFYDSCENFEEEDGTEVID